MDAVKVIVENWPKTNHFLEYVPVIIAVIALAVSLYSVYLTRRAFIASHRPYVWAINYGVIDADANILPIPFRVAYRVRNAPAKIIRSEVKIDLGERQLFVHTDRDIVRFPDERSEWSFAIGKEQFEEIMDRSTDDKAKLSRLMTIEYSSLGGGENYHFKLRQSFSPVENQWKDVNEEAD